MSPQEVAEQFVAAINAHDLEGIASLMTSDHRFIDSLGAVVEGRDAMREGWKFYRTESSPSDVTFCVELHLSKRKLPAKSTRTALQFAEIAGIVDLAIRPLSPIAESMVAR